MIPSEPRHGDVRRRQWIAGDSVVEVRSLFSETSSTRFRSRPARCRDRTETAAEAHGSWPSRRTSGHRSSREPPACRGRPDDLPRPSRPRPGSRFVRAPQRPARPGAPLSSAEAAVRRGAAHGCRSMGEVARHDSRAVRRRSRDHAVQLPGAPGHAQLGPARTATRSSWARDEHPLTSLFLVALADSRRRPQALQCICGPGATIGEALARTSACARCRSLEAARLVAALLRSPAQCLTCELGSNAAHCTRRRRHR